MKRQTYRRHELRAGTTVFFAVVNYSTPRLEPEVAEFLIVNKGPYPAEGEMLPYRLPRSLAAHVHEHFPLYRTRRAAWRAAKAEAAGLGK